MQVFINNNATFSFQSKEKVLSSSDEPDNEDDNDEIESVNDNNESNE